jgi:hypothetical protein
MALGKKSNRGERLAYLSHVVPVIFAQLGKNDRQADCLRLTLRIKKKA